MNKIKSRLEEFKSLPESEYKKEFMFCLLTPQSKAQNCWYAVEEISKLSSLNLDNATKILSSKTRFHHTKAKRIIGNLKLWPAIEQQLENSNILELRNNLAKTVNGYGLKEASHFLRNIGKSDNQIAILDRHILRNLHQQGLIKEQKIKSQKHYLEVEQVYLNYAKQSNILPDELDLLWWSRENGEIFK
ncbi:DNA lyase [Candidatus Pacearchaeota archaeon]|nr:DNA lyase [Candidatus Pacearchaeota archaeon]